MLINKFYNKISGLKSNVLINRVKELNAEYRYLAPTKDSCWAAYVFLVKKYRYKLTANIAQKWERASDLNIVEMRRSGRYSIPPDSDVNSECPWPIEHIVERPPPKEKKYDNII